MTTTKNSRPVNYDGIGAYASKAKEHALSGDTLAEVERVSEIVWLAERMTRAAVDAARQDGASWEQIGRALGTTRQGAWDRYGKDR